MPVKKILVVDDSPTERHVLHELLTRNGYQVTTAESGEEGIEKAKAELPDLILMDVVMPGLNGYQATRTLTRDEATKSIPIIDVHFQGPGDRQDLGLAPRRHRLSDQADQRRRAAREDRRNLSSHGQERQSPRIPGAPRRAAGRRQRAECGGLLGVQSGADFWLLKLSDSGEIVPLTPLAEVPLTRPWFAGIANIRGNLNSVVDFAAFRGAEPTVQNAGARLLLIGTRYGSNAALLVTRLLGLRNIDDLTPAPADPATCRGLEAFIPTTQDDAGKCSTFAVCSTMSVSWKLAFRFSASAALGGLAYETL